MTEPTTAIAKTLEPIDRLAYRVSEAAPMLGLPKSTLHDAIRTGKLRAVRLGKVILIPKAEIDRLLGGK